MADEVMETSVLMVPVLSHATLEQYLEIPFKICNRDNVHVVLLTWFHVTESEAHVISKPSCASADEHL